MNSGTIWGRFVEKTRGKKSRATVPLILNTQVGAFFFSCHVHIGRAACGARYFDMCWVSVDGVDYVGECVCTDRAHRGLYGMGVHGVKKSKR